MKGVVEVKANTGKKISGDRERLSRVVEGESKGQR